MDAYYFTAQCLESLRQGLPNSQFKNATSLVNWVRIIKSNQEIGYMKKAAQIVEKAMKIGIDSIQEGVRECDVVANIYHAQISGTDEFGGDVIIQQLYRYYLQVRKHQPLILHGRIKSTRKGILSSLS